MDKILIGNWSFEGEMWKIISRDAKELITKMLTYNEKKRISAKDAYNDKFF